MNSRLFHAITAFAIGFTPQWALAAKLEIVARIPDPDFSGFVVTKDNRILLGFPRHAIDHPGPSLAELKNGRLIPYPDREMTYLSPRPWKDQLVSPHGMTLDTRGRLWLIDDGKREGVKEIPDGAAKVVGIDLDQNRVFKTIVIRSPGLRPDSHLNDLRIDLTHGKEGIAIITDSSFGTDSALVVTDLATGESRRVLPNTEATRADPNFLAFLEEKPHLYSASKADFPTGGADGIALAPESDRVYITALSGRKLSSVPTDALANFALSEKDLEAQTRDEGERPACDGIDVDSRGALYFGAFEQRSLVKRNSDGTFETLIHDERLAWPDALFVTDRYLYVSLGQWNRVASFNGGKDLRKPPYLLARVRLNTNGVQP